MSSPPRPFYYLENFSEALACLKSRYADLLLDPELTFIDTFARLPQASAALLVRMIMRTGDLFRTSKLRYAEIGPPENAAEPLVDLGWVDPRPSLTLQQLCSVLRRDELRSALRLKRRPKIPVDRARQLSLDLTVEEARPLERWWNEAPDRVLRIAVSDLCERLRLMFFGSFRQDWAAFVLADLGVQRYETVAIDGSARAFRTRAEIEHFHALYRSREQLHADAPPEHLLASIPPPLRPDSWIETHRSKLLYLIGQRHEKSGQLAQALAAYESCRHPEARIRSVRVLERLGRFADAAALLTSIESAAANEIESQQALRIRPRVLRKLGRDARALRFERAWPTFDLSLEPRDSTHSVECVVRDHLATPTAPVVYVENTLVNSLFGLLFWDVIFAPVPGAFFHPFQAAPVDLLETEFRARRAPQLDACFAQLASERYRETILANFERKNGIQAPFVAWKLLTEELLLLALTCIPAAHLCAFFERLLADLRLNRTGLPDLIQFWPDEQRYRLIEVKGPGDRLQDNQLRWLGFCAAHGIPVEVCNVRWIQ